MERVTFAFLIIMSALTSCGETIRHVTHDGRCFYRQALPWEPVFQLGDSASAVKVTVNEHIGVDRYITFPHPGYYCNLSLWQYPIDTTISKQTTKEPLPMPDGGEGIVTRISYVFHSDSLQRGARIDSLGTATIDVPPGLYLAILTVGGYVPRVIKDLEVRKSQHSLLQTSLTKMIEFIY